VLDRLKVTADAGQLAGCGLVVEAVPEDVRAKTDVLQRVSDVVGHDCVIATNTSSLPVGELALAVDGSGRFLGLHFFNPVPASRLVEVVVGPATDPAVTQRAVGWVGRLGKTAVVSGTRPASRAAGSAWRSAWRPSGWCRRGSPRRRTSTPRWSWATSTRSDRCG
jgi:3-hydroxybutyryl-CoA dehydrogenase